MCGQRFHYIVTIWGKYAGRKENSARISDRNVHLKLSSWLPSAIARFFPDVSPWGYHALSSAGKMLLWHIPHQIKGIAWSARNGYDSLD